MARIKKEGIQKSNLFGTNEIGDRSGDMGSRCSLESEPVARKDCGNVGAISHKNKFFASVFFCGNARD